MNDCTDMKPCSIIFTISSLKNAAMQKWEYNMLVQDDFIETEKEVAEALGISRHGHEEIYGHAIVSNRLTQEGKKASTNASHLINTKSNDLAETKELII